MEDNAVPDQLIYIKQTRMISSERKDDWNELQFLSWSEFRQMAPSIIKLEVRRINRMLGHQNVDTDRRNLLVKTRFELKQFINELEKTDKDAVRTCATCLQRALLNISMEETLTQKKQTETFGYIADRLKYVLKRIELLY